MADVERTQADLYAMGKCIQLIDFRESVRNETPDFSKYILACKMTALTDALNNHETVDEAAIRFDNIQIMKEVLMA